MKISKCPTSIVDRHDISLICTKFGAFTVNGVSVLKDSTYPSDYIFEMASLGLLETAVTPLSPHAYVIHFK